MHNLCDFFTFFTISQKNSTNQTEIVHQLFYDNGLLNMQDDVSCMHDFG